MCVHYAKRTTKSSLASTQSATGWRPDTLALGTSAGSEWHSRHKDGEPSEKPAFPVAIDPYTPHQPPSPHSSISLFILLSTVSTSTTSTSPAEPSFSQPPLMSWGLASGQAWRLAGAVRQPHPVGTAPVEGARLLWLLSSNNCTGWTLYRTL